MTHTDKSWNVEDEPINAFKAWTRYLKIWLPLVLGIALGVGLAFWPSLDKRVSLALGLIGTLLGLVVSVLLRSEDQTQALERLRLRVNSSRTTLQLEQCSPSIRIELSDIIEGAARLERQPDLRPVLEGALNEVLQISNALAAGRTNVASTMEHTLLQCVDHAKREILAVSLLPVDMRWWFSDTGRRYFRHNKQARERGVEIQRIFITPAPIDSDPDLEHYPDLKRLLSEEVEAGIEVATVDSPTLKRNRVRPRDLTIFDNQVAQVLEVDSNNRTQPYSWTFHCVSEIDTVIDCYKDILRWAEPWPRRQWARRS